MTKKRGGDRLRNTDQREINIRYIPKTEIRTEEVEKLGKKKSMSQKTIDGIIPQLLSAPHPLK